MKILNILQFTLLALFLTFSAQVVSAQTSFGGKTCVGIWKTVDDETGKARSHVKIWEEGGKFYGKIEQLLNRTADEDKDPVCNVCPGDRKGKKVIGMSIIRGMVKEADRYAQGTILDPKKGKVYDCTMWLADKDTLKVRGWWGMVYRTQTWYRID
jgi:uncharacterized protein (DUF2147 family)